MDIDKDFVMKSIKKHFGKIATKETIFVCEDVWIEAQKQLLKELIHKAKQKQIGIYELWNYMEKKYYSHSKSYANKEHEN